MKRQIGISRQTAQAILSIALPALLLCFFAGCSAPEPRVLAVPLSPTVEEAPTEKASPTIVLAEPTETPAPSPSLPPPSATAASTATATPTPTPTAVPTRAAPDRRPIAIVVENEPVSRPQFGLAAADVVYEAVAEFYLTRFVAIFADGSADRVGPVRSGRDYHAAIAAEYDAALAHCIGVPTLAKVIAATKAVDLDGCAGAAPQAFSRDPRRPAPHNLFVAVPALVRAAGGLGTYGPLAGRADWAPAAKPVGRISFTYPKHHPIVWRYDSDLKRYYRSQDGTAHLDADGSPIATAAVVVQFVAVQPAAYFGESGYHQLTLTGKGQALIYAAGNKRQATWSRSSLAEPTRYLDASGEPVLLPPGKVFFQLVEIGTAVDEGD